MAKYSDAEVFGAPKGPKGKGFNARIREDVTPLNNLKTTLGDVGRDLLGTAASTADMIFGIPGQALGVGANMGTRALAIAQGESPALASQAGQLAAQELVPQGMSHPFKTALELAGLGQHYNQQEIVGQAMEKGADFVSRKTGGLLNQADVMDLFNTAMLGAGARGTDIAVAAAMKPKVRLGAENRASYVDRAEDAVTQSQARIGRPSVIQRPFADEAPFVGKTEADLTNEARWAARNAEEARRTNPEARLPVEEPSSGIGATGQFERAGLAGPTRPKGQAGEGVVLGETPPALDTALAKERAGQRFDMTAEERIALRDFMKEDPKRIEQAGAANPELLAWLGLGSAAAIVGYNALKGDNGQVDPERVQSLAESGPMALGLFVPISKRSPLVQKARDLFRAGKTPEEIWAETGVFRTKDGTGRWMTEISDEGAKLNEDLPRNQFDPRLVNPASMLTPRKLGDVLKHPEFYAAVPSARDINVKSTGMDMGLSGAMDHPGRNMYLAGGKDAKVRTTVLHELQHYLQGEANRPRGGSPSQFLPVGHAEALAAARSQYNGTRDTIRALPGKPNTYTVENAIHRLSEGEELFDHHKEALAKVPVKLLGELQKRQAEYKRLQQQDAEAFGKYKRLAGEVESRAVEARANMTPEERRATPPWKSWDVPQEEWITQFKVGEAASVKEKGGMWHPEAVERLARPLETKLIENRVLESQQAPPAAGGKEAGFASPELLSKLGLTLGAATAGAALSDDPLEGAVLAGVGTLAALSKPGRNLLAQAAKVADEHVGLVSTRLLHAAPTVARAAESLERRNMTRLGDYLKQSDPFMIKVEALPKDIRNQVDAALTANDFDAVRRLVGDRPGMRAEIDRTQAMLHEVGKELLKNNRIKMAAKDYFPRLVTDLEGLKKTLNPKLKTELENRLRKGHEKALDAGRPGLTSMEESLIVNQYLNEMINQKGADSFQPGFAARRTINDPRQVQIGKDSAGVPIFADLTPFYARPAVALHHYLRDASLDLEAAKFFGKNLKTLKKDGLEYIDYRNSIGETLATALREKRISPDDVPEMTNILRARFNGGEQPMGPILSGFSDLAYGGLLGNWIATVAQFSDIGVAAAAQGLVPTMQAMVNQARGKAGIVPADIGLINHVAEEFLSTSPTRKYANWALSRGYPFTKGALDPRFRDLGSFAHADMTMKGTAIEAARIRLEGLVKLPKGLAELQRRYGDYMGNDYPQLVKDLQSGAKTENVLDALFHEISRTQPISRLERSEWALNHPGGRVLLTLKNWTLKQADFVRREVYDEIKAGRVRNGVTMALKYGALAGVAGATMGQIQNWLLGKKDGLEVGDVAENIAKTFALNAYTRDKIDQGRLDTAVVDTVTPPFRMFNDILQRDPKAIRYLPAVGPILYNWQFGGKEEAALREERKQTRKEREAAMTPQERQEAQQRRKERREQRAKDAYDKKISLEDFSKTTFSDTPAERDDFDMPGRTVTSRMDFARQRMDKAHLLRAKADQEEVDSLIAEAKRRGGKAGMKAALQAAQERELRLYREDAAKRWTGRVQS